VSLEASGWVRRWGELVSRGPVLDLACGPGRHSLLFLQRGLAVTAVDREPQSIPGARFVHADLEAGAWPFRGQRFAAVVVTNYLHRALFADIEASIDEGGVLIYETFMTGNEKFGRPSNPAFLLRPGELLQAFPGLATVAFEQGTVERPKPAAIQRLCAVRRNIEEVKIAP
jgi:SAM-dependent methyltransferase